MWPVDSSSSLTCFGPIQVPLTFSLMILWSSLLSRFPLWLENLHLPLSSSSTTLIWVKDLIWNHGSGTLFELQFQTFVIFSDILQDPNYYTVLSLFAENSVLKYDIYQSWIGVKFNQLFQKLKLKFRKIKILKNQCENSFPRYSWHFPAPFSF